MLYVGMTCMSCVAPMRRMQARMCRRLQGSGTHMRPPKLDTLRLKRSTPLKPAKGSANKLQQTIR